MRAMQVLERARALEPNDPRIPNRLGLLLMREGREAEAEAQFDTAIGLDKAIARRSSSVPVCGWAGATTKL